MSEKKRVLMICLGNICRSPIAEAVFAEIVKEKGLEDDWEVDSAALIGYHTGKNPDRRAMEVLKAKGIKDYSHKARTLESNDYTKFDWIFGMDEDNLEELERKKPQRCKATIELLGKHDPDGKLIIRDPYYDSNSAGFYEVYEQCDRSIRAFLQKHS
ncbi:low molecular weight phosphotyrosine protein phosphatase isoform X2 [Nasonia vitripennis]|uniref:Low molecular weight phosphotyrosine protein phosphatase n=1 Tax=Nasonia vitripennis TaxID=7425 RepID=A0A7M7LJQ9_NASVI|nr:low molecular weight phosphotyrosine protein phosphatase isoform X2 [Nasonia vitripennis]